jgi:hypothetical protein
MFITLDMGTGTSFSSSFEHVLSCLFLPTGEPVAMLQQPAQAIDHIWSPPPFLVGSALLQLLRSQQRRVPLCLRSAASPSR